MSVTSDNAQGCSGNGRAISDRLKMLSALEEADTAKRVQIGRNRREEDAEIEQTRKREDEQRKERREEENMRLEECGRELGDKEEGRF
jgi:hypothetical protein